MTTTAGAGGRTAVVTRASSGYAVTRPARVHVAEIVVRPNKDLP